jgi:putative endonuclease
MLAGMDRVRSTRAQQIGDEGEQMAAAQLEQAGWKILGRNVRLGRCELDVVAVDPGPPRMLVLVEVRRRGRRDFGLPEETLDHRKRMVLRRAAGTLAGLGSLPDGTPLPPLALRVDLVAIDRDTTGQTSIRHHRAVQL